MFAAQAERTPDAVAVEFGDRCLSYRQLNARANRLARHLTRLGGGPDMLVGMCVERSLDMVVSVLGILKSGAAYVPLDPSYPKERLSFMLDGVRALVAERSLLHLLPQIEVPVVCLADVETALAVRARRTPARCLSRRSRLCNLHLRLDGAAKRAWRSMGRIACMAWWQMQSSRATAGTRTAQFASLSFRRVCSRDHFDSLFWRRPRAGLRRDAARRREPRATARRRADRAAIRAYGHAATTGGASRSRRQCASQPARDHDRWGAVEDHAANREVFLTAHELYALQPLWPYGDARRHGLCARWRCQGLRRACRR